MVRMHIAKRAAVALLAAGMAVLAGCGDYSGGSMVEQENKSLSMSLSELQYDLCEAGIKEYREKYPDVELNVEVYPFDDKITHMQRLSTELMAGKGPDLFFVEVWGQDDVYKMMKSSIFAPLDNFMGQDEEWDASDYVDAVLRGGVFDGKQMVMPLDYNCTVAAASKEGAQRAGISWDDGMDALTFMQEAGRLYGQKGIDQVFVDVGQFGEFPELLTGQFLDYQKGTIAVDRELLHQACEAYKPIYLEELEGGSSYPSSGDYGFGQQIGSGEAYFHVPVAVSRLIGVCEAIAADAEPVFCPLMNEKGEILANICQYVGVRANSTNQQNAWNMIKILLGDEVQDAIAGFGLQCPVRKASLEDAIEKAVEEELEYGSQYVEMGELPQEFVEAYKRVLMNPQACYYLTSTLFRFQDEMEPFYEGDASYEECLKEFEDYVKVYLTE